MGFGALYFNDTGSHNNATGFYALVNKTSGSHNLAIGYQAGRYQADGATALSVADDSIFIGKDSRGVDAATNQIVIGDTAIGLGSNTVVLGADSIVTTALKGNVGIGTTTPTVPLHVTLGAEVGIAAAGEIAMFQNGGTAADNADITLLSGNIGRSRINLGDTGDRDAGYINFDHTTDNLHFGHVGTQDDLTIDSSGNVGIGTTTPWAELDVAGGIITTSGVATTGTRLRLTNPGGGSTGGSSTQVGAIKVTLPVSWTNTMLRMTIKVYDYATNESFTVVCGGYTYAPSTQWINHFAYIESAASKDTNFTVRFGHDGTKCCIYIGELNSVWSYPQVYVTEVEAGFSFYTVANWQDGWAVGFEASAFGVVTKTQTDTQINNWSRSGQDVHFSSGTGNVGIGTTTPGGKLDIAQGTLTDDAQALNITSTWNDAADTFTLIKADVTNTASAAGSKLLDLQVSGVSKFNVDATGAIDIDPTNFVAIGSYSVGGRKAWSFYGGVGHGNQALRVNAPGGLSLLGTYPNLSFATDLILTRDAADTLGQRNGFAAQTYNIYNTYTNATNYERAHIGWNDTANAFVIGTEVGSGGGTVRDIQLKMGADRVFGVERAYANTAVGVRSLSVNTSGRNNVAVGYESILNNTTGWLNTAMGVGSLRANTTGWGNVAFGAIAMRDNDIGQYNVAVGGSALLNNVGGDSNVALGNGAGALQSGGTAALTNTAQSIFIGKNTKGVQSATNQIVIGDAAEGLGSNTTVLGSAVTTLTRLFGKLALGKDTATTPLHVYEDNTSGGSANGITIEQDGTGDSILQFLLTGAERWMMGVDNSDGDKFKIEDGTGLTSAAALTIDTASNVGIGTASPTVALDVSGSIAATGTIKATPTTVAALPAASTAGAGARTFVTDSNNSLSSHHGQTVTGGGANFTPVYSDGTNWRVG